MKTIKILKLLYHLPKTIYFNFHYLPFKKAIKFPFVFTSPVKMVQMKGSVEIRGAIHPGMIIFGGNGNVLYRQSAKSCIWSNYGGKCIFGNKVEFSDGIAIEIGQHGHLQFGNNIFFGPMVRIACYDTIKIGDNTRVAWEGIILDTDFHSTIDKNTGLHSPITKPVIIGKNNWIGIRCLVMKGTVTPDFCIASAYSLLNKTYDIPSYSLIGGVPAKFLKEGVYRDLSSHVNDIMQRKYDEVNRKK